MTRILSIDASTEACSVALLNHNEVTQRYQLAPRQHAQLILPMVESLLATSQLKLNQLDAIACNVGPGAFTGIRIAVSVAQGLAYGAGLPSIALSSLANMASSGYSKTGKKEWLCAIDARMNEVYLGAYKIINDIPVLVGNEQVIAPEEINFEPLVNRETLTEIGLIGSGWPAYPQAIYRDGLSEGLLVDNGYPDAQFSLKQANSKFDAGEVLEPQELQPTYLRNNVAEKKSIKN